MRSKKEITNYMDEAFDKVWLCRTSPCDVPDVEARRKEALARILETYDDLDELNDDWGYGFWSGVLATLRWVLGEEDKRMLDS